MKRMSSIILLLFAAWSNNVLGYQSPTVIQGGMGIRISSWELAREVARSSGELGVISGTGMDCVFVRTLQAGDPGGHMRRALASFPDQDMAKRAIDKFYINGGKDPSKPFRSIPMWTVAPSQHSMELAVLANYCEVWLAKHNDDSTPIEQGFVGINRLTKVQLPTLFSLYGAMLADVDYVIMGAGIPLNIPGALDNMAEGKDATLPIDVANTKTDEKFEINFSPQDFWSKAGKPEMASKQLKRPAFVPIVSSVVLAQSMLKRASGKGPTRGIDGFVVELPTAGGHNAPPRGFRYDPTDASQHLALLNDKGEPMYGPKDEVDMTKFKKAAKDLPFWFAGSFAHPEKVKEVVEAGGAGVQVGTLFALSKESGMDPETRTKILSEVAKSDVEVFTDPAASPTGYPFKVLKLDDTLAGSSIYEARPRQCNLGYLRQMYIDGETGKLSYKCPAEPVEDWVKKGGEIETAVGRKCLCNALMADAGFPQTRAVQIVNEDGEKEKVLYTEDKLITIGDEVNECRQFMKQDDEGKWSYSARDVVRFLKSQLEEEEKEDVLSNSNEPSVLKP